MKVVELPFFSLSWDRRQISLVFKFIDSQFSTSSFNIMSFNCFSKVSVVHPTFPLAQVFENYPLRTSFEKQRHTQETSR